MQGLPERGCLAILRQKGSLEPIQSGLFGPILHQVILQPLPNCPWPSSMPINYSLQRLSPLPSHPTPTKKFQLSPTWVFLSLPLTSGLRSTPEDLACLLGCMFPVSSYPGPCLAHSPALPLLSPAHTGLSCRSFHKLRQGLVASPICPFSASTRHWSPPLAVTDKLNKAGYFGRGAAAGWGRRMAPTEEAERATGSRSKRGHS